MAGFTVVSRDYGSPLTQKLDNTGGTDSMQVLYVGETEPGTAVTAAKWRIKKLSYDANNNVTDVQWAGGTDNLDKVWNNRTTYVYS